jgi:adenosylcobinamide-GDP ribazoletransferase
MSAAAFVTVVFWTVIPGLTGENGLGARWAAAIALSVLARWQALAHLAAPGTLAICIAAQAVPRASMVALAWVSRPAGGGSGLALSSTLTTPAALFAIAQGIVAALACGLRPGFAILAGAYAVVRLARWVCYRRLGGVDGDGLAATEQLLEMFILILFTCTACRW